MRLFFVTGHDASELQAMSLETVSDLKTAVECAVPYSTAEFVVPAQPVCVASKAEECTTVRGKGVRYRDDGRQIAPASCGCDATQGQLIVFFPTLFGIEEDNRVLVNGPWRVY